MKNLACLEARMRLTSFISTGTLKCYRSRGRRWTWARTHWILQLQQQINWFSRQMHPQLERPIWHQKFRLPQLSHFQALPCWLSLLPNSDTQHPSSQRSMCQMSSDGFFPSKSAFQSKNFWLELLRSEGISNKPQP